MTLEKCSICGMIYPASGFFVGGESVPEDLKIFSNISGKTWEKLIKFDPRCSDTCGYCTVDRLKAMNAANVWWRRWWKALTGR